LPRRNVRNEFGELVRVCLPQIKPEHIGDAVHPGSGEPCSHWQRSAWFSQLRHSLVAAVVAVTEVAAAVVDTEAAWAAVAASMAVDLVVVGASTAAVVASIAALVSTALV
jgi:hypothetical protein